MGRDISFICFPAIANFMTVKEGVAWGDGNAAGATHAHGFDTRAAEAVVCVVLHMREIDTKGPKINT